MTLSIVAIPSPSESFFDKTSHRSLDLIRMIFKYNDPSCLAALACLRTKNDLSAAHHKQAQTPPG
ncbi:hypothetical protein NEUTE1DRAFT_99978 [Neurospora tetrasperma FGSC 2508]|uniref:Uncharacterized protein n=1 Tax=Neurospora tetrasperma (strain FGSC 2508 / ATCC MYA-4615 / P0657) TaxID=510951 RepID=F8MIM9_NEUT8|nr:uncharacterized protein NEUTE1DRAFT_99978 [Neurospora tetrasperma FGSC 2508]EGO59830.1 hypothetical protein NEUTE1DRAFT_99978 [Neurospora tetrasperma FGSC 2508]EGZ73979.1 hypothetical protein NEUTE2DRAFT_60182 [Neurospora tetrasperma FGSC 2509]